MTEAKMFSTVLSTNDTNVDGMQRICTEMNEFAAKNGYNISKIDWVPVKECVTTIVACVTFEKPEFTKVLEQSFENICNLLREQL